MLYYRYRITDRFLRCHAGHFTKCFIKAGAGMKSGFQCRFKDVDPFLSQKQDVYKRQDNALRAGTP